MNKFYAVSLAMLISSISWANPEIEAIYKRSCMACHVAGVAGAPKSGDAEAWAPRLEKGYDALLLSIKNGYKGMPAKGLCFDCTDEQYIELTKFMSGGK